MLLGARTGLWSKSSPAPTERTVAKWLQWVDIPEGTVIDTGFCMDSTNKGFKVCIRDRGDTVTENCWAYASCFTDDFSKGFMLVEEADRMLCTYSCDGQIQIIPSCQISGYSESSINFKNDGVLKIGVLDSVALVSESYDWADQISNTNVILGTNPDLGGALYHMTEFFGTDGDEVVCHLVPVIDNNDDVCLYDTVSGEFKDDTYYFGPLVAGPELPYDYEVEWLKSDGSSYVEIPITTGVNLKNFLLERFEFKLDVVKRDIAQYVFASRPVSFLRCVVPANSNTNIINTGLQGKGFNLPHQSEETSYNDLVVIANAGDIGGYVVCKVVSSGEVIYESSATRSTNTTTTCQNLYLFGAASTSSAPVNSFTTESHFKRFAIKSSSLGLNMDLITVCKDNIGYLYDRCTGNLIGNSASSGALIMGPRKS